MLITGNSRAHVDVGIHFRTPVVGNFLYALLCEKYGRLSQEDAHRIQCLGSGKKLVDCSEVRVVSPLIDVVICRLVS